MMKIIAVAGTRPNFVKIAPLMAAFAKHPAIEAMLVHTGQHYDARMSEVFFQQLGIPEPDINLGVGSGTHAEQMGKIMMAFEPVVTEHRPDVVVVVGDVNSTIACGIVAVRAGVKLAHVEAGLRSGDRAMPEEINRLMTDAISDYLFCSEPAGVENLRAEGHADERVIFVGNVMIDTLLKNREKAEASDVLDRMNVHAGEYAVLTLHRPSNVDDQAVLGNLLDVLDVIQKDMPIIFPVHPRTRNNLLAGPLGQRAGEMSNLKMVEPAGYLDFLKMMASARLVLTDSGGIQEETTILKVPCLTLRENTERPITAEVGSNQIVGTDPATILAAYRLIMEGKSRSPETPPLWDGHAAERVAKILVEKLAVR